jgi:hypothetical protein
VREKKSPVSKRKKKKEAAEALLGFNAHASFD